METVFECMMVIAFGAAVGTELYRMVRGKMIPDRADRVMLIMIGAGFIVGAIEHFMRSPIPWTAMLYVIGAFLTYTTVLFSLPVKGEKCHE